MNSKDIKLGISIYPENQSTEDIISYVEMAKKYGYTRIFTSILQATEENKDELIERFKEVLSECSKLGFEVVLDVAPHIFPILGVTLPDVTLFKEMSVDTLRFDELDGSGVEVKVLQNDKDIEVELNVSTSIEEIETFMEEWGSIDRLKASHNFYPQAYTGLPLKHFKKMSRFCKKHGIRVQAFITSKDEAATIGPWGINEGLCSLEEHRRMSAFDQAQQLMLMDYVDDISFGNAMASEEELKAVSTVLDGKVRLQVELDKDITSTEEEILLNFDNHFRRPDINEYTIRSTFSRLEYADKDIPARETNKPQSEYEIYIPNNGFDRYKGEVHVVLKEMPFDERKNLVGKLTESSQKLVEFVGPGQKIIFTK